MRFGGVWKRLVGFGNDWWGWAGFGGIWSGLTGLGGVWGDLAVFFAGTEFARSSYVLAQIHS